MLKQREVKKLVDRLTKRFPWIITIIQFGSSVSGDYNKDISDIDLAIIINSKKEEKKIENFIFKYHLFELQTHIFPIRSFIKSLKQALPLSLSILYTGKPLYGTEYYFKLKNRNFRPNKSTIRKCMLNSFAALGLAISDLIHGMLYDSVNSIYHAARSSIWATLFSTHITPNNKQIFELIKDKKTIGLYKKIIRFRENIPNYAVDFDFSSKIYKKGNINQFTQLLENSITLIKINYKKIFGKNFIGLFELLKILNKKYREIPEFYSIFLSIDWEKEKLGYHVSLSFKNDKRLLLDVDANSGRIKELVRDTKKIKNT